MGKRTDIHKVVFLPVDIGDITNKHGDTPLSRDFLQESHGIGASTGIDPKNQQWKISPTAK